DPSHPENKPYESAYPRAGTPNAEVRLGIVSVRGGPTTWIDLDHARLPYVATVKWQKGAPLTIYAMDRLQQNAELYAVDAATGK
ncbi:DPP IV N-terminal domain-containing protein, partial [Pseudomonas sp. GW460-C8]|uniref:DPP IV N-terminal domain-containing protein n=1 Tax=Pseudomonas sp. GW460-C8 TaxID=2070589 RepID=UPI000CA83849